MPSTTTSLASRGLASPRAAIRFRVRNLRQARARQQSLRRDLATYTSESDLNDLGAILDCYDDADTRAIRGILAAQRSS
jgi:hypothetical protein